jgi:hypothetical protein
VAAGRIERIQIEVKIKNLPKLEPSIAEVALNA